MKYIVRKRNSKENIYIKSSLFLNILYSTFIGRFLLKMLTSHCIANVGRIYLNSIFSIPLIKIYIKLYNIDLSEYEDVKYKSFNEFFIRKIKDDNRKIIKDKNAFISPCDSYVSVYKINKDLTLKIKDSYYSINTLVEKDIINGYIEGYAFVFRLDSSNYHRYCYIDNGSQEKNIKIKGILHTVQPISLKNYNYFKTNSREYTVLHTSNFDDVIDIEIGALMIGRIVNEKENNTFKKGEEKGHFEFGGSTICLLVKKDILKVDDDVLNNSNNNIETIVKYGEQIAFKIIR